MCRTMIWVVEIKKLSLAHCVIVLEIVMIESEIMYISRRETLFIFREEVQSNCFLEIGVSI